MKKHKGKIMNGYQLTFYTEQSRTHHDKPVGDWLLELVKSMKIGGATLSNAVAGVGRDQKLHSAHFFDLADQPVEVTVIATEEGCTQLLEHLNAQENLNLFYVKIPAEFGSIGQ
jgi:PII-like signaling protein